MAHKSPAASTWWANRQVIQDTREVLATRYARVQAHREGTYSRVTQEDNGHGSRPVGSYRWSAGLPVATGTLLAGEPRVLTTAKWLPRQRGSVLVVGGKAHTYTAPKGDWER